MGETPEDKPPNEKITVLGDDGIHTLIHRQPLDEEGNPKAWEGPPDDLFWGHIEELQRDCIAILEQSDFPNPNDVGWFVVGLGWLARGSEPSNDVERKIWLIGSKQTPDGEKFWKELGSPHHGSARGHEYAGMVANPYSEEWYAAKILQLCLIITGNRESSYAGHLVRIYQIAEFEKDREWRRDFGLMIKRDIKGQKGRKDGGRERRGQTAPKSAKVLHQMWLLIKDTGNQSQAARSVAEAGIGTSARANLKLWQRNKHKVPL